MLSSYTQTFLYYTIHTHIPCCSSMFVQCGIQTRFPIRFFLYISTIFVSWIIQSSYTIARFVSSSENYSKKRREKNNVKKTQNLLGALSRYIPHTIVQIKLDFISQNKNLSHFIFSGICYLNGMLQHTSTPTPIQAQKWCCKRVGISFSFEFRKFFCFISE